MGAEVRPAPGEDDTADRRAADEAGLSLAGIDAVLDLEEAGFTVGVDVVGDRRAAGADGGLKDGSKGFVEAREARAGEAAGNACGADAGAEETFVGVDVADAVEERLVEERGFDGKLAAAEEGDEVVEGDGEGFASGSCKGAGSVKGEAAETAGVDKAELAAGGEAEDGVGVEWERDGGGGDEEAASHAEVDDQLR